MGLKTQKLISAGALHQIDPTGGAHTALPGPIAGEEKDICPLPKNLTRLVPPGFKNQSFGPCCSVPPHFYLPSANPGLAVWFDS